MDTLKTNIFDWNRLPLCEYLDPGCPVLRFATLKQGLLLEVCPNTVSLAEQIGRLPWRRDVWGLERDDGFFFTISAGSSKHGARPFSEREVLRTFVGKQSAITTSDAPYSKWRNQTSVPQSIRVLRIDVDDDRSWADHDEGNVLSEICREQQICALLGFPYNAFKTGRRGHQGVIPLPVGMPFSLATLFLEMYLHIHERSGNKAPMVDKTNLSGQMRMPGGRHRKTQDLALFIDIDNRKLFDIEAQANLMVDAFQYSSARSSLDWEPDAFKEAAQGLLDWTSMQGIERNRKVEPAEMRRAVTELQGNPIVERFRRACDAFGLEINRKEPPVIVSSPIETPSKASSSLGSSWATQVFEVGFQPGGFWEWLNMKGNKGILAAHILFGEEGAQRALEGKAMATPAKSQEDKFDRLNTIRSCMSSFRFQPGNRFQLGEQVRAFRSQARIEVKPLLVGDKKSRWHPDAAIATFAVLLEEASRAQRRWAKLGIRTIQLRASTAFPDIECSATTVRRSLARLVESGIIRKKRSSSATSDPDVYIILKGTPSVNPDWTDLY